MAAVVVVSVAGCGKDHAVPREQPTANVGAEASAEAPWPDQLGPVCTGTPFAAAPAYAKSEDAKLPAQVVVFAKYLDEAKPEYRQQRFPFLRMVKSERLKGTAVSLVACIDVKRQDPASARKCSDDRPLHGAAVTLRIVEARTGKELAKSDVVLAPSQSACSSTDQDLGRTTDFRMAALDGTVFAALAPFEPKDLETPPATPADFSTVCAGSPIPRAAVGAGEGQKAYVVFSHEPDGFEDASPRGVVKELVPSLNISDYGKVVCVVGHAGPKRLDCEMSGGHTVELHDATYDVRVVDPRTARVIDTKTFTSKPLKSVPATLCPALWDLLRSGTVDLIEPEPAYAAYLAKLPS